MLSDSKDILWEVVDDLLFTVNVDEDGFRLRQICVEFYGKMLLVNRSWQTVNEIELGFCHFNQLDVLLR